MMDIFTQLDPILGIELWGNKIQNYFFIGLCFLLGVIVIEWMRRALHFKKILSQFENYVIFVLYLMMFYGCLQFITFAVRVERIVNTVFLIVLVVCVINLINKVQTYFLERYFKKHSQRSSNSGGWFGVQTFSIVAKILVWIIGLLILLNNFGFNITPLLAGLGVSGIAVAFIAQTLLQDLLSCFVIYFDKPFECGDFIVIDSYFGTVEHIGIKTTRLRSLNGEEIILSNSALINSKIRNYKSMKRRRIVFDFQVAYSTSLKQLQTIPEVIQGIINNVENSAFDRAHFFDFGNAGFLFEVVYFVSSGDYTIYMDVQQKINLAMVEYFAKHNIEFVRTWVK